MILGSLYLFAAVLDADTVDLIAAKYAKEIEKQVQVSLLVQFHSNKSKRIDEQFLIINYMWIYCNKNSVF